MKKLLKYLTYRLYNIGEGYKRVAKADDAFSFIWEFQQYLRSQYKWGDPPDDIEKIYDKWFEKLNDNDINMDELYS